MTKLTTLKQQTIIALQGRIVEVRRLITELEDAGLRKTDRHRQLVDRLNRMIADRDRLEREDIAMRRECARDLLAVLAVSDLLATVCDKFIKSEEALYDGITEHSEVLVKKVLRASVELGEAAALIDKAQDWRMSWNFAEMSDELLKEVGDLAYERADEVIRRHHDAGNGHNLCFKPKKDKK